MKKLSILMALVLMLVAIVPVAATPATAAEATPASSSMDEALIMHLDFNNIGDQGASLTRSRPLDVSGYGVTEQFYAGGTTFANGVATLTSGSKPIIGGMNNFQDFASCTTGMTAFMAVKLDGKGDPATLTDMWLPLMSARGASGYLRVISNKNQIQVQYDGISSPALTYSGVEAGKWVWIAVSLNFADAGNTLTLYVSFDEGESWDFVTCDGFTKKFHPQALANLYFGADQNGSSSVDQYNAYFDDIQIYNRALTADEIRNITIKETTPSTIVYQTKAGEQADTFDIRFCAAVDTYALSYESLSYKVVVKNSEGTELATASLSTTTVYTSVLAMGEPYTAAEMGSDFLTAVAITGIPTTLGELTFEVTPSFVNEEMRFVGPTTVFTYNPAA